MARMKVCLCYKINYPQFYNLLFTLIIALSLVIWTSTPEEGMVKGKLESWIQKKSALERGKVKEPLQAKSLETKSLEAKSLKAKSLETESLATESLEAEYLEALMAEEEPWLMETTQVRLWIGRRRLIGYELHLILVFHIKLL